MLDGLKVFMKASVESISFNNNFDMFEDVPREQITRIEILEREVKNTGYIIIEFKMNDKFIKLSLESQERFLHKISEKLALNAKILAVEKKPIKVGIDRCIEEDGKINSYIYIKTPMNNLETLMDILGIPKRKYNTPLNTYLAERLSQNLN